MTAPSQSPADALEAARRVVETFAWAAGYKAHRNRPERDAYHAARALLSEHDRLTAEVARLREALEGIAQLTIDPVIGRMARAALPKETA